MKIDTLIVKGLEAKNNPHGAVVPPIYLATTFAQDGLDDFQKYAYSRSANPTRNAFEELLPNLKQQIRICSSFGHGGDLGGF